jgi:hypothetical protein
VWDIVLFMEMFAVNIARSGKILGQSWEKELNLIQT